MALVCGPRASGDFRAKLCWSGKPSCARAAWLDPQSFLELTVEEGDSSFTPAGGGVLNLRSLVGWTSCTGAFYYTIYGQRQPAPLPFVKGITRQAPIRCVAWQKWKNLGLSQVCAYSVSLPRSSITFSNSSFYFLTLLCHRITTADLPRAEMRPGQILLQFWRVGGTSGLVVLKGRWTNCTRSLQSYGRPKFRGDKVSTGQYSREYISWHGGFRMCTDPDSPKLVSRHGFG